MAAGELTLSLLLKTGSFETDTKRAERAIKDLHATASKVGAAIGVSFVAAGVGMVALAKNAIDALDDLNDLSQKTGVAVEDVGALGFAASKAGGDLQSMGDSLGKLNKQIALAAAGNADAKAGFKAMGISVRDSAGNIRGADAVLLDIADRFEGYEDGANKVALATKSFGKSGADIIPVLNQGGDALRQQIAYYKQHSGVTADAASKADEFNDTMADLKLVVNGFVTRAVAEFLPTLKDIADYFLKAGEKGTGFGVVMDGLKTTMQTVAVLGANVAFVISGIAREFTTLFDQAATLGVGPGDMAKGPAGIIAAISTAAIKGQVDIKKFGQIHTDAMNDAAKARAKLDEFEGKVMGTGPSHLSLAIADRRSSVPRRRKAPPGCRTRVQRRRRWPR